MPSTKDQLETIMSGLPTLDVWRKTVLNVERQALMLDKLRAVANGALDQRDTALARVAELEKLLADRDALDATLTRSAADEIRGLREALEVIARDDGNENCYQEHAAKGLAKVCRP